MVTEPAEGGQLSPASLSFASPTPPLSAAYSNFISRRYFPPLDGLRCLSIVAVVAHHAGILSRGIEGVSLFFVISGFLITTILLREQSITGSLSLTRFYLRRTFRVFPLYYAVLVLYVVLVTVLEKQSAVGSQFWDNFPYFLTYTSNWFVPPDSDRVVFFFAWSLATEEQFYLFWPWVIKAGAGPRSAIATMLGLLMLHYGVIFAGGNSALAPDSLFIRVVMSVSPAICLGAIAAILVHRPTTFRLIQPWIGWRWSASAALAATLLALAFDATPGWIVYLAMTWLVLSCALRPDHQPLGHVLTNPFVKHVGIVSYGIYLMHMLCINIARGLLHTHDGPLVFGLALGLSIAAATLSYRFFESPFLRWKDRLARRPEAR